MDNTLHNIGNSLAQNPTLGKLSRRGFMAASAATLASCKAATSTTPSAPTPATVKTTANTDYRTPSVKGPVPRNESGNHPSNFSKDAGVTFSRVLVSGNYIAITFDDGPHPQNTPRLLDMLAARNIKATFYVIGRSVDLHPGVLRRTVAEGHEIGNHSHTHRLLSKLSDAEVRQEMQRCQDAIGHAAGVRPRTMRPPYGGLLQRQRELVHNEFGYPTILWSVDPLDWKRPGPSVVASRILSGTTAGGIVLAHDLHSQTVDAMPATLDGLLRKGFKFVTVSQLIAMKAETPAAQASVTPAP
ncbi:polysaccharide deacetylase family protein [Luteolibacter algae]|uniref:Polysaccharide deacetylase family protein n=1 Tax=Luteolibacter algae TaxID=454151 RepID=A0ABW5D8K5_9BACT